MLLSSSLFCAVVLLLAIIIDHVVGEPKKWHPLIGFGWLVEKIEAVCWRQQFDGGQQPAETIKNAEQVSSQKANKRRGLIAVMIIMLLVAMPAFALQSWISDWVALNVIVSALILYVCIAPRSLREHAQAIAEPLARHDLAAAREKLSYIVSRDVSDLSEPEIATAVCESVLENGSDAIFAAIFWFLVAGIPGVVIYRASNTLDAMWGYRNIRYNYFGWAAAKLDDGLNWLPARLVALSYALMGDFVVAMRCWREQGSQWKSPNAGPVMSAGAGSLGIRLGGAARYHGEQQARPVLGEGRAATVQDINRALRLVYRVLLLWMLLILLFVF
ncbi:MAG: adenosylcobinamide-phosphate synthase CbiB [Spongiibacteraceae bacterium]